VLSGLGRVEPCVGYLSRKERGKKKDTGQTEEEGQSLRRTGEGGGSAGKRTSSNQISPDKEEEKKRKREGTGSFFPLNRGKKKERTLEDGRSRALLLVTRKEPEAQRGRCSPQYLRRKRQGRGEETMSRLLRCAPPTNKTAGERNRASLRYRAEGKKEKGPEREKGVASKADHASVRREEKDKRGRARCDRGTVVLIYHRRERGGDSGGKRTAFSTFDARKGRRGRKRREARPSFERGK